MNRCLIPAFALLVLGASCLQADTPFGHARRPMPVHPGNAVPVEIRAAAKGEPARLIIPRSLLARAKKMTAGRRVGALHRPLPLLAMGMLSAAGVGLLCRRGRRFPRVPLALLAVLGVAGAGVSLLWANPPSREGVPAMQAGKECRVEIVNEGGSVRLIVPREQLPALSNSQK